MEPFEFMYDLVPCPKESTSSGAISFRPIIVFYLPIYSFLYIAYYIDTLGLYRIGIGVFPSARVRFNSLSRRLIAYLGLLALALGRPNYLSRYLLMPRCRRCSGASDENTNGFLNSERFALGFQLHRSLYPH